METITQKRWHREKELIQDHYPNFKPFLEEPWFGFQGHLLGRRTGRLYEVVIEGHAEKYPQYKPAVYMQPRIGSHWVDPSFYGWVGRPRHSQLCLDTKGWNPAKD